MKILAVSDEVVERLYSLCNNGHFGDVQLILGCGDLPYPYLENLLTILNVPRMYVPGNHDPNFRSENKLAYVEGGTYLDLKLTRLHVNAEPRLDRAVESLLDHWTVRRPIGPCHFGIGTLFMQVEYPLLRYNLFNYVYVLSFYDRARHDRRYREALRLFQSKLDARGRVVVERPNRRLAELSFCAPGRPSDLATARYREIVNNLQR